jgi:hypothetical protein
MTKLRSERPAEQASDKHAVKVRQADSAMMAEHSQTYKGKHDKFEHAV